METARPLQHLAAGDLTAWPDLARDLERSADAERAAEALRLLHAQGHVVEAAQWLARATDAPDLQDLRGALRAHAEGWPVGGLRALAHDLLSGAYRLIPAGSFVMGSPPDEEGRGSDEAQHPVELTRAFLLKTTPVTQSEWEAVMGSLPSYFVRHPQRPVEQVSWHDAVSFGDALAAQTGGAYRLPTEAEWEYAARAGSAKARYGAASATTWHVKTSKRMPQPVGQKQPNAWGLHDMLGNVWEWCHDWYAEGASGPTRDPEGPPDGTQRVIRGGAWNTAQTQCRAAQRSRYTPTHQIGYIGARLACALPKPLTT